MPRRLLALAAAGLACCFLGCTADFLRPNSAPIVAGKVVETPTVAQASGETAERVDEVGSDLLTATPLGIPDISCFTIGGKEPELFHRDPKSLFISEGLVSRCRTDDELAAVLALEMGKMTAEFRRGVRKQAREPMPAVAGAPKLNVGTDLDPARDAYLAQYDSMGRSPAEKKNWPTVDPHEIAVELLRNSGREPKLLKDVAPLLTDAANGPTARRLGASAAPSWGW
jgi:hypothetical protein